VALSYTQEVTGRAGRLLFLSYGTDSLENYAPTIRHSHGNVFTESWLINGMGYTHIDKSLLIPLFRLSGVRGINKQKAILKLVVCILLRVLGQVQGFRLTQHWFEYFI
jgi:hypothetical protein